ncbi:MAG: TIGR03086 family protein [Actinophytocola sp.]|uniref:TIGR03086 family metal-binding protein n=1 Tax=Actinophytocola sp. TaxID=1872138 RepID=UPI00132C2779|nr:TIGR03086 family metal-binding protein [Actinophytocola sp.]MPZ84826.1 TIGR03086 family protein [Actinophytocola sp.]
MHKVGLVSRDPETFTPLRPTAAPVCVTALEKSPSTPSTSDFPPPCQEPRGSTADAKEQDHATPGDWDSPTPCTEWSVRDLVNHLVNEQLWVPDLLAGKTVADVGDKFDGDLLEDDPLRAWTESSQAARAAWLRPGSLVTIVHLSFGDTDGAEYCWQMTTDLAVHGWDLATAVGADAGLGDELATAVLDHVAPQVAAWQGTSWFADPVPVPDDAAPQARLVALLGRAP